ncbi:MAG: glycerophosphodiester phosphodiesterase family protein [Bacteroidota bacterium]
MKKTILFFSIVFMISCKDKTSEFLVIGHRGAMGHVMENTMASIQKAMEMKVDMIEIDVFRIKDGEIIVFHDDLVDELTDGKGPVEGYDLDNLQTLTLHGNHKIPTLVQVMDLMKNQTSLNIELKGSNTAESVNTIIQDYVAKGIWTENNIVISSFRWDELRMMRKINPDIAIAVLTEEEPLDAIPEAKALQAIAINPDFTTLTAEKTKAIHEAGFKVFPWTVNEPKDIESMKTFGVDGIFINYPERAR